MVAQASTSSLPRLQGAKAPKLFILSYEKIGAQELAVIDEIRSLYPEARVVVVGADPSIDDISQAFRKGAHGYLPSSINSDALVKSLEVVIGGVVVLPGATQELFKQSLADEIRAPRLVEPRPVVSAGDSPPLSARELLILKSLVKGDSNKHIARQLDIAEATVKVHVKAILRKIRVRNRTQAAIWAMNVGLPPAPETNGKMVEADARCIARPAPALISLNS